MFWKRRCLRDDILVHELQRDIRRNVECERSGICDRLLEEMWSVDPEQYLSTRTVKKVFEKTCAQTRIGKSVTVHTLQHCFAAHLLEDGDETFSLSRSCFGPEDVSTTMIYTHVLNRGARGIRSPADSL